MCPRELSGVADRPGSLLPRRAFETILEFAPRIGHLNVNGLSENLLHPRFLELLEELQATGSGISFSTNGTLITEKIASRLAKIESLQIVSVSIDSADPEEYRRIRGGDLERVRAGLRNLITATNGALRITASAVVMEMSRKGVPLLPAFLSSVGVKDLVLQAVVDPEKTPAAMGLPADARAIVDETLREGLRLGVNVLAVSHLREQIDALNAPPATSPPAVERRAAEVQDGASRSKICSSPWSHIAVDCYGRVFPCCNSPSWVKLVDPEGMVLGDLTQESLEEVWNGRKMREFRDRLVSGDAPDVCRICPVVPDGVHPFREFAAEIAWESCEARRDGARIVARNAGPVAWTRQREVFLATSRPRERACAFRTSGWVSWTRAARMREDEVPPGGQATFDLELAPPSGDRPELFELLVEGLCWLPGSEIALVPMELWHPVSPHPDSRQLPGPAGGTPVRPGDPASLSGVAEERPEMAATRHRAARQRLEVDLLLARRVCADLSRNAQRLGALGVARDAERDSLRAHLEDREAYLAAVTSSRPWRLAQWLRGLVGRRW